MTIRYDMPYSLPSEVEQQLDLPTLCEVDVYLAVKRDKSRTYRVVTDYHRRARKARCRYTAEVRKY